MLQGQGSRKEVLLPYIWLSLLLFLPSLCRTYQETRQLRALGHVVSIVPAEQRLERLEYSRQVTSTIAIPGPHVCNVRIMSIALYSFGGLKEITNQLLETDCKCPINVSSHYSYYAKLAFSLICCLSLFSRGTWVLMLASGISRPSGKLILPNPMWRRGFRALPWPF